MGQFLAPRITTASRSILTLSASELVYDSDLARFFGGDGSTVGGFSIGNIVGSGTTNQISYFTASGTIASLTTTTYPSLTELSYVKGVTSSIQTQLNGKQATGNYITALTGDVTASGPGSVAATIANAVVTYAKIQNVSATSRVLGRKTAGAGSIEELSSTDLNTLLGLTAWATKTYPTDAAGLLRKIGRAHV